MEPLLIHQQKKSLKSCSLLGIACLLRGACSLCHKTFEYSRENSHLKYLLFYVPLKNISLIWRRHQATKFRSMLGAQGLCAGRDLYRATPAVTQDLGFFGLIRRTAPFSRLLRHTRRCGGSILTRILTGYEIIEDKNIFN
jgi:hypothetical protein